MPDIRTLLILNPRAVSVSRNRGLKRVASAFRMALRRFALRTGGAAGFRQIYLATYKLHVWVARWLLTRFEGTRAIYLSAGLGRGEVRPGISDIDLVIFGDWDDKKQLRVLKSLAIVVLAMPLFDRESLGAIQTWDHFLHINDTCLLLAYQYAYAKTQWKLVWGEDLIQNLPSLPDGRRAGAAYLDIRRWWGVFARMAFGQNVTAEDDVFRNSLSFKAIADVLRAKAFAFGAVPPVRRTEILRHGMPPAENEVRDRLLESEARAFLGMDGDPREFVMPWLLRTIESLHVSLPETPSFLPAGTPHIEGCAAERLITHAVSEHAHELVRTAQELPGLKAAYLLPCAGFFAPDSLMLCIEFASDTVPTAEALREWIAPHLDVVQELPQRLSLYLLLENGAYLLDCVFGLEIWANVLTPHTNPDVFVLLACPDFVLKGEPRLRPAPTSWSRVSEETLREELDVRRAAQLRFGVLSRPSSVENLRNIWRFLQLLTIERRDSSGKVTIPVTIPAIRRQFGAFAPDLQHDLQRLEAAMVDAVNGRVVDANAAIQSVYDWTIIHGLAGAPPGGS